MNSIFYKASFDILTPQRAQELESFAQAALKSLCAPGETVDEDAKISKIGYLEWERICSDPAFIDKNPILNTRGGLDYLALCKREGIDLYDNWNNICESSYESMTLEMERSGLHGLHFRMNLPDPSLRLAAVGSLAEQLFYLEENIHVTSPTHDYCHYPLSMMSCAVDDMANHLDDYQDWISGQDPSIPEYTSARLIELLQFEGAGLHPGSKTLFELALKQLVLEKGFYQDDFEDGTLERDVLLFQIQKTIRPLVYNVGYRMKIEGRTDEQVQAAVEPVIDSLLNLAQTSPNFARALKRQILINLFSAFPESLERLQARPEELQGVMLDEVLITHPDARHFRKTLGGPLALFSAQETLQLEDRGRHVIEFLTAAGYPLHADIAIRGVLAGTAHFDYLLLHCQGPCKALETHYLTRYHDFGMPYDIARRLMLPDVLDWYDDASVVKIVKLALPHALGIIRSINSPWLQGEFPRLDGFMATRPSLIKPILDILSNSQFANFKAFEYFGFSGKELNMLGTKASDRLREDVLTGDLGL